MAKNDIFYVTIPNWDKYQERPDRGNFLWFKLLNGYFDDAKIFELGAHGKLIYVYILCQVSKSGGGASGLHLDKASTELKIKKSEILNAVHELRELSLVTLEELPGSSGKIQEAAVNFLPRGEERRGEEKRGEENHSTTKSKRSASAPGRPPEVSDAVWQDFVQLRRAKRAPITATALDRIASEAAKAGWPLEAVLAEMVARGWQGVKAEWLTKSKRSESFAEKNYGESGDL